MEIANVPTLDMENDWQPKGGFRASARRPFRESLSQTQESQGEGVQGWRNLEVVRLGAQAC